MLTIAELAETVSRANHQGDAGVDYWTRVFRNLHTAGLLPAADYRGHGRTAAALYDTTGVCAAGVAAALTRSFRVEPAFMREVLPKIIAAGAPAKSAMARVAKGARFAEAVEGVVRGEEWFVDITIVDHSGRITGSPFIRSADDERRPRSERVEETLKARDGAGVVMGKLTLNLADILRPYLSAAA